MSNRYGEKSRGTQPITGFTQRPTAGGGSALNVYEAEFLAPGTWTWPGNVSFVDVLVVGGGQAGGSGAGTANGGAGGVGVFQVPVSAPVPVTVGAGGTAPLGAGGTTWFGPSTPPAPNAIARAGGGNVSGLYGGSRPGVSGLPTPVTNFGSFGTFGGVSPYPANLSGGANGLLHRGIAMGGMNKLGYGGGVPGFCGKGLEDRSAPIANTGNGGSRATPTGYAGGSGYVLVRWYEP